MFVAGLLIGVVLGYMFCGLLTVNEREGDHVQGP